MRQESVLGMRHEKRAASDSGTLQPGKVEPSAKRNTFAASRTASPSHATCLCSATACLCHTVVPASPRRASRPAHQTYSGHGSAGTPRQAIDQRRTACVSSLACTSWSRKDIRTGFCSDRSLRGEEIWRVSRSPEMVMEMQSCGVVAALQSLKKPQIEDLVDKSCLRSKLRRAFDYD